MTTPIERAAEALEAVLWDPDATVETQARAVFESIDFEELRDVVGHIWNPTFLAAGIKTYLLGEQP